MREIGATALFCDDVRRELHGKITIVGVYRGVLGLTRGETVMAKLVALLLLSYKPSWAGRNGRLQVLIGETPTVDVPLTLPPAGPAAPATRPDDMINLNVPIEMMGFKPADGMVLRVRFSCESFSWSSEPLEVRAPPQTAEHPATDGPAPP